MLLFLWKFVKKYKSNIFKDRLSNLTAAKLVENLADYKEFKRVERLETIEFLKQSIDNMYADEKIKEEKLIEYTQGMVRELKRTSFIKMFANSLLNYMPKYNELKHFNRCSMMFAKQQTQRQSASPSAPKPASM